MKKNHETEIKLEINKSIYNILMDKIPINSKKAKQINYFFDSKENHLLKIKWTLRIRTEEEMAYITSKGPCIKNGSIYSRPEFESCTPLAQAKHLLKGFYLSSLKMPPLEELKKRVGDVYVSQFLCFKNERIYFKLEKLNIELDKTIIKDQIYYEIEVETDSDKCEHDEKELRLLFKQQNWDFIPSKMSKFSRALNLIL